MSSAQKEGFITRLRPSRKSVILGGRLFLVAGVVLTLASSLIPKQSFKLPSISFRHGLKISSSVVPLTLENHLVIPKIGIDAAIQAVGETAAGNMAVPSNYSDVGWFKLGPHIGEPGNAVIAGHLDGVGGQTAVFKRLHELRVGDTINYKNNQKQQTFRVTGSQSYDVSSAPLSKIFGKSDDDKAHLNLITCSGAWDKNSSSYNQRLVVYSELTN